MSVRNVCRVHASAMEAGDYVRSPGAGVTSSCEPPDTGAGNWVCPLTVEPPLRPHGHNFSVRWLQLTLCWVPRCGSHDTGTHCILFLTIRSLSLVSALGAPLPVSSSHCGFLKSPFFIKPRTLWSFQAHGDSLTFFVKAYEGNLALGSQHTSFLLRWRCISSALKDEARFHLHLEGGILRAWENIYVSRTLHITHSQYLLSWTKLTDSLWESSGKVEMNLYVRHTQQRADDAVMRFGSSDPPYGLSRCATYHLCFREVRWTSQGHTAWVKVWRRAHI